MIILRSIRIYGSKRLSGKENHQVETDKPVSKRRRLGRRAFWIWIAYQSIKGAITLSLIWIPLFWFWLSK